jgi:hypothetical protein
MMSGSRVEQISCADRYAGLGAVHAYPDIVCRTPDSYFISNTATLADCHLHIFGERKLLSRDRVQRGGSGGAYSLR